MRKDREVKVQITQTQIEYFCDRCGMQLTEEECPTFGVPKNTIRQTIYENYEHTIDSYDLCNKCWEEIVKDFKRKR